MDDIGADDAALMEELPPGAVAEPDEEPPTEAHQWQTKYELLRERHDKLKADRAKFVEKAGRLAKKVAIQDDFLKVEGAGGGSRGRQLEILQTELDRRDRENALLKRKLGRAALQAKDAPSLSQCLDAANPAARFGAANRPRSPARPGSLSTEAARLVALEGELAKLKAKQRSDQTDLRRTREELVRLGKMNQALRANSKRARKERVDIARAGAYADASALAAEQRGAPDDVRRHVPPDPVMKFSNPASMLAGAGPGGPATPSAVEHTFGGTRKPPSEQTTRLVEDALRRAAAEAEGPSPRASAGAGGAFAVGAKVEARFRGGKRSYGGVVARDHGDGTYDIDYDDGEKEAHVAEALVADAPSPRASGPPPVAAAPPELAELATLLKQTIASSAGGDAARDLEAQLAAARDELRLAKLGGGAVPRELHDDAVNQLEESQTTIKKLREALLDSQRQAEAATSNGDDVRRLRRDLADAEDEVARLRRTPATDGAAAAADRRADEYRVLYDEAKVVAMEFEMRYFRDRDDVGAAAYAAGRAAGAAPRAPAKPAAAEPAAAKKPAVAPLALAPTTPAPAPAPARPAPPASFRRRLCVVRNCRVRLRQALPGHNDFEPKDGRGAALQIGFRLPYLLCVRVANHHWSKDREPVDVFAFWAWLDGSCGWVTGLHEVGGGADERGSTLGWATGRVAPSLVPCTGQLAVKDGFRRDLRPEAIVACDDLERTVLSAEGWQADAPAALVDARTDAKPGDGLRYANCEAAEHPKGSGTVWLSYAVVARAPSKCCPAPAGQCGRDPPQERLGRWLWVRLDDAAAPRPVSAPGDALVLDRSLGVFPAAWPPAPPLSPRPPGDTAEQRLWALLDHAVAFRAGKGCDMPNFKGLGRVPLVSADFWTNDELSERSRSVDAFVGTRARGTLKLKIC